MLDLTSYRRKQKYALPLTVMRQFYYDYKRTLSIKNKLKFDNNIDPLARQTLSVQKFQKCLHGLQNDENIGNVARATKVNSTCDAGRKGKISLRKMRSRDDGIEPKQSGYFKSVFSSSVAFLKCHPSIQKLQQKTNRDYAQPPQQTIQATKNSAFNLHRLQIRNPSKQLQQMQQNKSWEEQQQKKKKNRMKKIRQNWLIEKIYKNEQKELKKEELKTIRIRSNFRIRQDFTNTKENIFPL